jgi:hypothetical protein
MHTPVDISVKALALLAAILILPLDAEAQTCRVLSSYDARRVAKGERVDLSGDGCQIIFNPESKTGDRPTAAPIRRSQAAPPLNLCMAKAKDTYTSTSGGKPPPEGMTREYCECAATALESGDTFTKSVEFCRSIIYPRYGLQVP